MHHPSFECYPDYLGSFTLLPRNLGHERTRSTWLSRVGSMGYGPEDMLAHVISGGGGTAKDARR